MNDFLQSKCEKCGLWHPRALSCVSIALQQQAREAFDQWFYAYYTEMKRRAIMYLDVVHDQNEVVIFNTSPEHILSILATMNQEARSLYTVTRGQDLKRYTVQEYLDLWSRKQLN